VLEGRAPVKVVVDKPLPLFPEIDGEPVTAELVAACA
jgi:hypothetical protein